MSASVLITGMLVFSGLGAYASERFLPRARSLMPKIFVAIGALLIGYGLFLDRVLDLIGTLPYGLRLVFCFALIFPPAFLMGFPMPTAMTSLARLGKDHMFLWAWGINGCFSVIGAAAVPIVATLFGLHAVLMIAGGAYLLAIPAFFAVLIPLRALGGAFVGARGNACMTGSMQPCSHRRRRLCATLVAAGLLLQDTAMSAPAPRRELAPLPASKTALVPFDVSPFPYRGEVPEKNRPFLDVVDGDRHGHASERGGTYWEDQTYSDRRVLLHIPKGFDPRRPALIVVFFHGNEATLARDVRNRQQVPRQVAESGLNAVLVAPQFAVDALDFERRPLLGAGRVRAIPRRSRRAPDRALRRRPRARGVPRRAGGDRGL